MLSYGNQFPIMGNDTISIKNQILNYGLQIQNLSLQGNNMNNVNNMYNLMRNMGMQMNNNLNYNMNPILNMNMNMNNNQNDISLLQNEFKSCCEDSYLIHSGTKFELENNNIYVWNLTIQGPLGTPYEEGFFKIKINFPSNYPKNVP